MLDIEVQGVAQLKKLFPENVVTVFLIPPSFEELEKRIRGRGTEDEKKIQRRLQTARKEIEILSSEGFADHKLINDDLEESIAQAKELILDERS